MFNMEDEVIIEFDWCKSGERILFLHLFQFVTCEYFENQPLLSRIALFINAVWMFEQTCTTNAVWIYC